MRKTVKTMLVIAVAATFFAGSLSFAADQTRTRDRKQVQDQRCLSTQRSGNQSRQMFQQRLNQGSGAQSRVQKQSRGGR
jgi:hypothetical protein